MTELTLTFEVFSLENKQTQARELTLSVHPQIIIDLDGGDDQVKHIVEHIIQGCAALNLEVLLDNSIEIVSHPIDF